MTMKYSGLLALQFLLVSSCCEPFGSRLRNLKGPGATPSDVIHILGKPEKITEKYGRVSPVYGKTWYSGTYQIYYWRNTCNPEDHIEFYFAGDRYLNQSYDNISYIMSRD